MRNRRAEEGHDPVTGELVDGSFVAVSFVQQNAKAAVHDLVDFFRIELLRQGGEVRDIREHDRDKLSFPFDEGPLGQDLFGKKFRRVRMGPGKIDRGQGGFKLATALAAKLEMGRQGESPVLDSDSAFNTELCSFRVLKSAFGTFHYRVSPNYPSW